MLTYWVLRAQDSTDQKLSNAIEKTLQSVCNTLFRWINSPLKKRILECMEIWLRLSSESFTNFKHENLESILQMINIGFESKICLNIILNYSCNPNSDMSFLFLNQGFLIQILKYALLADVTCNDSLEMSLISVEIIVSLLENQSNSFIQILGKCFLKV